MKRLDELVPTLNRLLEQPEELARLRSNTTRYARPTAARTAAAAILKLRDSTG